MAITASAWRLDFREKKETQETFIYRVQIEPTDERSRNKVNKQMNGWTQSGWFFKEAESNENGLLFTRRFANEVEWLQWARDFGYPLVEISMRSDGIKPIKLGTNLKRRRKVGRPKTTGTTKRRTKRGPKKKVVCGNCGQKGHNARSCKNPKAPPKPKIKKKKIYCSICGFQGHNKATCPKKKSE